MKKLLLFVLLASFVFVPFAVADDNIKQVTVSSAPPAAGTCTDWISPGYAGRKSNEAGYFNVSVYGASAWSAEVYLQRRLNIDGTFTDAMDVIAAGLVTDDTNFEDGYRDPDPLMQYRLCVKQGGYTSGSVVLTVSVPK